MWRPKERIRHEVKTGNWPNAEEAAGAILFSPLKLRSLSLANRTWVPAMVPWRASEDGYVTQDILDWYERFAEGRPGAIVVEATGIRDIPSGPLLRIGHDRFLPGLQELVQVVKKASGGETRLFIQLIDFLAIKRRPKREDYFTRFLKITDAHREKLALDDDAIRQHLMAMDDEHLSEVLTARELEALERGLRERVTDTHLPHIADLPKQLPTLFAQAAKRAEEAGFDGVELHYAHAYTMASFLSALNNRDDGYGGSLDNRVRLPLEVFKSVRGTVQDDFIVGCRMLSEDCIEGGSSVDDVCYFAKAFADAGMDFISLSRGGKFEDAAQPKVGEAIYPYTGRSGYECMPSYISDEFGPFERNREPTARIKASIPDTPVVLAGGIHDFQQAEGILQSGDADIIAFARQALADPDWFQKVRRGEGDKVRVCRYTNYCEALDQKHKQVTCELWDREALDEPGVKLSKDGKRRLIAPR
ncbi:MAG: NADH:flavin oxidoreductase [Sphingomonadales bacterium]